MGEVITFYSYKGGVGRTMALANVAVLLSKWEYKVLIVDWDLEAPGLEFFFKDFLNLDKVLKKEGIIELLCDFSNKTTQSVLTWKDLYLEISITEDSMPLHFITAGKRDKVSDYFGKVSGLDLEAFYSDKNGGFFIESLRNEWKQKYDFILIDSRTGITDLGGICTVQLPDILVLLFTATNQSLQGTVEVAKHANLARHELPIDRYTLLSVPILSRFDAGEEFKISQEWLNRFDEALSEIYAYWLPTSIKRREFIEITKLSYLAYFSFGEKLPVLEQGTRDPQGLGYTYETISALIAHKLASIKYLFDKRSDFVNAAVKRVPLDTSTFKLQSPYPTENKTIKRILKIFNIIEKFDNLLFIIVFTAFVIFGLANFIINNQQNSQLDRSKAEKAFVEGRYNDAKSLVKNVSEPYAKTMKVAIEEIERATLINEQTLSSPSQEAQ